MKEHVFDRYLRPEKLKTMWCPGCGNGIVLQAIIRALDESGADPDKVVVVSGVGCSSRAVNYLNTCGLHTNHGRPIAYATGVKMANPALTVVVITGDGEYALNGTTYMVTGLVLPEKTVENDNITITTANDEATLLNVAPVFEETPEDSQEYQDIFSLFTEVKDDPKLLAKVFDLLGGVAYAEEDEDGRDLNVKVFRIGLEDVITGEAVEPGTELHVETSLDQPITGEDFSLYHIADGKNDHKRLLSLKNSIALFFPPRNGKDDEKRRSLSGRVPPDRP